MWERQVLALTGEKAGDQDGSPPRDANCEGWDQKMLLPALTGQRRQDHIREGRKASI